MWECECCNNSSIISTRYTSILGPSVLFLVAVILWFETTWPVPISTTSQTSQQIKHHTHTGFDIAFKSRVTDRLQTKQVLVHWVQIFKESSRHLLLLKLCKSKEMQSCQSLMGVITSLLAAPTRSSLGSQPTGSKLSLPRTKLPGESSLQKTTSSFSKPANKSATSSTTSKISTTRLSNSKSQSSLGSVKGQQSSTGSKLAAQNSGIPGKLPVNIAVTKPSGLTKPAIKGTMTKLDNLKPGL